MSFFDLFCCGPITGLIDSFVKNVFCDSVTPQRGAILRCDLLCGRADHTGIYLGSGRIAELDGDGHICEVTPEEFLNKSNCRTGICIYVACDFSSETPLDNPSAAEYAEVMLGESVQYNLLLNNCHQFVSGCLTGDFKNGDSGLFLLESTISETINGGNAVCWRAWER